MFLKYWNYEQSPHLILFTEIRLCTIRRNTSECCTSGSKDDKLFFIKAWLLGSVPFGLRTPLSSKICVVDAGIDVINFNVSSSRCLTAHSMESGNHWLWGFVSSPKMHWGNKKIERGKTRRKKVDTRKGKRAFSFPFSS